MRRLTISTTIAIFFTLISCDSNESSNGDGSTNPDNAQSGPSKQEEIADEIMGSMQEFAIAINNISDAKTSKEAAIKIKEIKERYLTYAEELKELDPLEKGSRMAIEKKMEAKKAQMKELFGAEFQQIVQSLRLEEQKLIDKSFREFFEMMESVKPEFERHFEAAD